MRTITISLIVLILSTNAKAEVKSAEPLQPCLTPIGLFWKDWLLVGFQTHKAMLKDAEAYKDALEKLSAAQADLIEAVSKINELQLEMHELKKVNYDYQVKIYELENPLWYKHPAFWGATGVAAGLILTAITTVLVLIGTGGL